MFYFINPVKNIKEKYLVLKGKYTLYILKKQKYMWNINKNNSTFLSNINVIKNIQK